MIKLDPSDDTSPSPGWRDISVLRHRGGTDQTAQDHVAEEWPVALVFNGISHAVMMTTPRDLDAFAVGFALSEGIVRSATEIRDIETEYYAESAEVRIDLLQGAFVELKDKRRSLAGRTGCGVCGIESLDLLDLEPEQIVRANGQPCCIGELWQYALLPMIAESISDITYHSAHIE